MFTGFLKSESIISRAIKNDIVSVNIINIRDYCFDKHKQYDDVPFGGGHGMLMNIIFFRALKDTRNHL